MTRDEGLTLCVDVGKTRCRVGALSADGVVATVEDEGAAGAAAGDGAAQISGRVLALVARLSVPAPSAVGVGAAGVLTDPGAGKRIARELAERLRLPVAVASDAVTAHVGALGGEPGVSLIAGTGAVALGVSRTGELRRVDGWGTDVGDLGGGSWIGREGIRAVLGAACGLGPPTALFADLPGVIAPETDVVRWVSGAPGAGRRLAMVAPAVLRRAEGGDAVALEIAGRAVTHLADTAHAASDAADASDAAGASAVLDAADAADAAARRVCALGGLTRDPWFAARLAAALRARGLVPADPAGTALDGARAIALRADLPHERYIHRAQ
ncbi:BadF/BadG/BcrA/BcrD ATPase family protein [Georgenia sp. SYP-B2076]|uniref:BadF/BadG/BcrA/BcrD ATPase family protein n=1 Tax=Georgenia sp. SYP-B2076 TaxID=2495881 RepID=UPI0013DE8591|nr:BadF/BadG/BcrA/BcrD ATPase family protein [Georgenia sp. SYP-B2076]